MRKIILSMLVLLSISSARGAVRSEVVAYNEGKTVLEGVLYYDDTLQGKRPGVVVVHEWMGLDDYAKRRAKEVAELGYVTFAADIYGKGVRATNTEEAGKLAGLYKSNRPLFQARMKAALEILRKNKNVDSSNLAAIGYCFGGTGVLELARSGADVKGVISFHGGLDNPTPANAKNIKGKVLILHGTDDPYASRPSVLVLADELKTAGVDYQINLYSNAVHGFTNPGNGSDNSKGVAYNAEADKRSWEAMKSFFTEIFN